jgi:hypothetical protein
MSSGTHWELMGLDPARAGCGHGLSRDTSVLEALCERSLGLLASLLIVGNLSLTRSFAHLGVAPVYIGELALGWFLLVRPQAVLQGGVVPLYRPCALTGLAWCGYLSLVYGLVACLRGIAAFPYDLVAIQNLVFHVYPVFLLLGLWLGAQDPGRIGRILRALAWVNGIYGALYLTVLERWIPLGQNTWTWFGQPAGAAISLLGILCFPHPPGAERGFWTWLLPPLALNVFVLLGVQVRAEWLGFAAAVFLWGLLAGRLGRLVQFAALGLLLLIAAYVTDLRIEARNTHAGEISVANVIGRGISAISPQWAEQLTDSGRSYASTVSWRTGWWRALWQVVHSRWDWTLLGPGYGYPIWEHHPEGLLERIRTPHNVFMYALAYTGWIGLLLFVVWQGVLGWLLWRACWRSGTNASAEPFGICLWGLTLCWATFDNFFETPFGAIPFYLLCGLALAPILSGGDGRGPLPQPSAMPEVRGQISAATEEG